jgi:hypothetical protein
MMVVVVMMGRRAAIAVAVVARLFRRLFHDVGVFVLGMQLVQLFQVWAGQRDRGSNQQREQGKGNRPHGGPP